MGLLLGAIADDFTGATDLANTLVKQGMRALQIIDVPSDDLLIDDADAVVVALKSRTAPAADAVSSSLAALEWLQRQPVHQYFFKYCSTFDSSASGNIGPVADALKTALKSDFTLVCPAFPANQRRVFQGHLFVGDQLLSESPMQDHPLTPMRDANLRRLLDAQSSQRSGLIPLQAVRRGAAHIRQCIDKLKSAGFGYGVVDAVDDDDLLLIGEAAADHLLVTGGSGVALGLPRNFRRAGLMPELPAARLPAVDGRCLVLAGSCSVATRAQIETVLSRWPSRRVDVDAVAAGDPVAEQLIAWAAAQDSATPLLIHAAADPTEVSAIQQRHGAERAGALVEGVMAKLACGLTQRGFDKLIVAGGETSGAVVSALGIQCLRIGPEIDPGVPWTEAQGRCRLALALKSGNFGCREFFIKAFEQLACRNPG